MLCVNSEIDSLPALAYHLGNAVECCECLYMYVCFFAEALLWSVI